LSATILTFLLAGRTPLHLAVISSTPEIVGALINHGARLVARLADGRTALHLAAARGSVEMVKMILQKSEQNEEEEAKKEEIRKQARQAAREGKANPEQTTDTMDVDGNESETQSEDSDIEMVDGPDSDEDMRSTTTGSYVKIKEEKKESDDLVVDDQDEDEPDVYDVNVLAWDTQCSALHYAILNGHRDVVKELVQTFGADVLLPIKLMHSHDKSPRGAILTLVLALELPLENAKAMVQTLLEIGASSAQADTNQTTALHYISGTQPEVLEMLFHHDEPSAKRAINHLAVPGSSWSPCAQSPLMSAIVAGNSLAAMKLLEAGAEPIVDFKAWLKSVSAQHDDVAERDSKRNHDGYVKDVEQPIILAALAELPELVIELLKRGVDPNTLPKGTQQALVNEYHHNPRESLLDIVRKRISQLRNYKDDKPPGKPEHKLVEGVNYLESIEPGTYKEFIAKIHLNSAQDSDKRGDKAYEDQLKEYNERTGIKEKQEAIDAMAVRFKELEQELVRRGAKTYKELYPEEDAKKEKDTHHYNRSWSPRPDPPFSIFFDFNVYDLENDTREAYCKLFQAAWDADLDTIKSLTLAPWGPSGKNKPLKIAVEDRDDQSPFSIAMLRGHTDVARAIVEIAFAQYQPETEEKKVQYRMGNEDEEDDDEDDEGSASSDVPVHQQTVSVNFTVDNIGEVSTQVKSKTSPLNYIAWTCTAWTYKKMYHPDQKFIYGVDGKTVRGSGHLSLIAWAITTNDWSLFAFMLDLNIEWASRLKKDADPDASAIPNTFSESDFLLAIKFGRLDMLAKMISHNGAGMQLASLVKRSGVKYQEKPKFYQGLSVHGKKRADWVSAARGTTMYTVSDSNPPLLHAAFKGSLSSVEWFLSDAPLRHYREFANTYKDDKLINHLNTVGGGFDKVLSKWLGARREIALHCAVLATPTPEATKLIAYLIQAMPDSINIKSRDGYSPLALAFSLRRLEAAKLLIAAGADQTVRNSNKANLLHHLLVSPYTNTYLDWGIQDFLDLLDKRLIPSLLVERCSNDPGSLTPLARWLRTSPQDADVLRLLLDFAKPHGNQHLEMLDGSGDTPLHYVVTSRRHSDLKIMLEYRPELLYRENSVGRTPYELAADAHIASAASSTPNVTSRSPPMSIVNHHPEKFLKQDSEDEAANNETIWRICERHMQEHPGKRKLVSLLDANEVAKRLANRYGGSRQNGLNVGEEIEAGSDDGNEDTQDYTDEVSAWYHLATQPKPGR
jgi:ankyrin repeat protein